ncbi:MULTISPECIES: glutamate--cysteine ligase [unclassified Vibrio]|uniref:Glutamate--cysteine ligase n=1 Tax=Vibrio sp. HB236076 TaxID=3232307 RepID=A0AB39H9X6_9VIBR|nr:glutamate--cysteine ligase [Vibrio sp. HB161653]MDP5253987.1 glutamate--cysteine ligase [Vibrio sp. HB161653]
MTNFSDKLGLIAQQSEALTQLGRGVERETLRYDANGHLSLTSHPENLGSAYTNQYITTDFSESLLEFITPVSSSIPDLMAQLSDIHHFTQSQLGSEKMWPLSMPCYIQDEQAIPLAQYGTSNGAKMKTLYREGLKRRYGSLMQVISGVHFNFSFPESFWDALWGEQSEQQRQESKSAAYFGLIRNYYRFGWLIPYLFGASPALCSSFVKGREGEFDLQSLGETRFLPYATSLRLSDLGYTNSAQSALKIGFNSIEEYLSGLDQAIRTPSEEFAKIGIKEGGEYRQLNSNVLQIENELYAPIRPKRVAKNGEKPSQSLKRGGVEYIEVRSLDVNPFSPVGLSEDQVRFLDLFLTWAVLSDSSPMTDSELECWRSNWRKVVVEGRKPDLMLKIGCDGEQLTLNTWAHRVFDELEMIAVEMDRLQEGHDYQEVCQRLRTWIDDPSQTLSAKLLDMILQQGGLGAVGCQLGQQYQQDNLQHTMTFYTPEQMKEEVSRSWQELANIEAQSNLPFDDFLADYFQYLRQ